MLGWFFSDYRVSPNFFVVLGLRLGLGCDNFCINSFKIFHNFGVNSAKLFTVLASMAPSFSPLSRQSLRYSMYGAIDFLIPLIENHAL